jgi:hypothetical protein
MKCQLCERDADSDVLCRHHAKAKKNVETAYQLWKDAYGEIAFSEYLETIVGNPETGRWAIEVARMMLQQPHSAGS